MIYLCISNLILTSFEFLAEYMPGGSLYNFLHKQDKILEHSLLLKVALGACNGMVYLHQNNIIHRDLKTANLLIDNNNVCNFLLSVISYPQYILIWILCVHVQMHLYVHDLRFFIYGHEHYETSYPNFMTPRDTPNPLATPPKKEVSTLMRFHRM